MDESTAVSKAFLFDTENQSGLAGKDVVENSRRLPNLGAHEATPGDVRGAVERRFTQMNEAHDRIRSRELALRLASNEVKRALGF